MSATALRHFTRELERRGLEGREREKGGREGGREGRRGGREGGRERREGGEEGGRGGRERREPMLTAMQ